MSEPYLIAIVSLWVKEKEKCFIEHLLYTGCLNCVMSFDPYKSIIGQMIFYFYRGEHSSFEVK